MTMHPDRNTFLGGLPSDPSGTPITVAAGDGIGPEIMAASLRVLFAAGARLSLEPIEIGEQVYKSGISAGITPDAWASLRRTRVFYKAPITTPQGSGYKSLNVTVRKSLGLYANVRPCSAYAPFVPTKHPAMDLVIVRENEEDLYAGIEHRQTQDVYQCLKLITRPGTERIVRYAFEYARAQGRRKVTCFTKDNIMKMTDGLFHKVFDEMGREYPELEQEHWIVDIGAARLADNPQEFDVIVMPNLYGDILSDVAAQIAGSIGLAGTANIGDHGAMFEAIHGSAPPLAGKDLANPSGLLLAGVHMLCHIGQAKAAEAVHNAWLRTIEDGVHTFDIYEERNSRSQVGTRAFADAVIDRLGQKPQTLKPVSFADKTTALNLAPPARPKKQRKDLVGVDVFVDEAEATADQIAAKVCGLVASSLAGRVDLLIITNRGVKVWPEGLPETFCTDHWRLRFMACESRPIDHATIAELLHVLGAGGVDFVKTEALFTFDGTPGFSLGQGQ